MSILTYQAEFIFARPGCLIGILLKWNRNSVNSGYLINHLSRSMNWAQFKDSFSYMCLAGAVLAFWSLTQEVSGSNTLL